VRRIVVDASVMAAVTFGEPDGGEWARRIEGAAVFAPRLLQYELASVARRKCRRHPQWATEIVGALRMVLDPAQSITWLDPDPADVVLVATATCITTYDASYLCLAGLLDAELVTGDAALAAARDPFSAE
jgi:predicted nucleic acid-binding protein